MANVSQEQCEVSIPQTKKSILVGSFQLPRCQAYLTNDYNLIIFNVYW